MRWRGYSTPSTARHRPTQTRVATAPQSAGRLPHNSLQTAHIYSLANLALRMHGGVGKCWLVGGGVGTRRRGKDLSGFVSGCSRLDGDAPSCRAYGMGRSLKKHHTGIKQPAAPPTSFVVAGVSGRGRAMQGGQTTVDYCRLQSAESAAS